MTTNEIIILIGGLCISLTAIAVFIRGVYRIVKRIFSISDAVRQLRPNGGSSLADKINEMNDTVQSLDGRLKKLEQKKWLRIF